MMQSNAFSNAFITSTGIAEPPETQTRRLDGVGSSSWPGALSIAWYIVGTPSRIVTLSRAMISSALRRVEARDQRQAGADARPRR